LWRNYASVWLKAIEQLKFESKRLKLAFSGAGGTKKPGGDLFIVLGMSGSIMSIAVDGVFGDAPP
jgi:hypothetical protein